MSIPNDISTYEKMANMKNLIGGSFIELLKQSIKSKQNENVIKMLDIAKDKPETYLELLPVAIFHQNMEIVKYIVEKYKLTEADTPNMNALSFVNAIFPDNYKEKLNELKDNYVSVQSPFVIIGGIGGNIEIFQYLLNNKLISNKKQVGFIGLSKKLKNLVSSNVIGACSFYGKHEILEFLLKNFKNELDTNLLTTEKKSKNNRGGFVKEYSGLSPCMLAIVGPSSDSQTIDVLKILNNYNTKFDITDFNKENILHLATRNKKIETAKFLIDDLNLKYLLNETNKDGQTPLSLAKNLNYDDFISYYNEKSGIDEKEIEKNISELINESAKSSSNNNNKKKKKNKKAKNNDIPTLLNTNEYQESLKVNNQETKKTSNSSSYNNTNSNSSRNNYDSSINSNKLHALLDKPKPKKKKEKIEVKNDKEESKKEEEIKEIKEEKEEETKKIEVVEKPVEEEEIIVGLSIKKNKKNKKGKKNKENENEKNNNLNKEKELEEKRKREEEEEKKRKEEEERKRREEEEEQKRIEEERRIKEEEEAREREEQKIKEEEEKKREEERKKKEEEEKKKKEEEEKKKKEEEEKRKKEEKKKKEEEEKKKKKEEEKKKNKKKEEERNGEEEEEEDYSYSDDGDFLNGGSDKEKEKEKEEKEEKSKKFDQKDYEKLNKNYLELERKILLLEKEKEELTSYLKKIYLEKTSNPKIPITSNNEENINDLMLLVNKELEKKDDIIHGLEEKVSKVDLKNIEKFNKKQLLEFKDLYTKNLTKINDAMKQYS